MKTRFLLLLFITSLVFALSNCNKTAEEDKALYSRATDVSGFTYYKDNNSILPSSNPSAHNPFFRVRFNAVAYAALTDSGRLPVGSSFPEGALIVKELYDSQTGDLKLLAVMEKSSGNSAAGAGFLWGEYNTSGKAVHSISKKGDGCISCHSEAGNRDYSRLFELFP